MRSLSTLHNLDKKSRSVQPAGREIPHRPWAARDPPGRRVLRQRGRAGEGVGFVTSFVLVTVVAIYVLVDLPRVRRALYLLAPRSRRPRMVLLTDEMLDRVGGYVLGNLLLADLRGAHDGVGACSRHPLRRAARAARRPARPDTDNRLHDRRDHRGRSSRSPSPFRLRWQPPVSTSCIAFSRTIC